MQSEDSEEDLGLRADGTEVLKKQWLMGFALIKSLRRLLMKLFWVTCLFNIASMLRTVALEWQTGWWFESLRKGTKRCTQN